jgi:hypothetical protein
MPKRPIYGPTHLTDDEPVGAIAADLRAVNARLEALGPDPVGVIELAAAQKRNTVGRPPVVLTYPVRMCNRCGGRVEA